MGIGSSCRGQVFFDKMFSCQSEAFQSEAIFYFILFTQSCKAFFGVHTSSYKSWLEQYHYPLKQRDIADVGVFFSIYFFCQSINEAQRTTLLERPLDFLFVIYLVPATFFCVFRGLVRTTETLPNYRCQPVVLLMDLCVTVAAAMSPSQKRVK